MPKRALLVNEKDNVAVALEDLRAGDQIALSAGETQLQATVIMRIPFGHKFAVREIAAGEQVIKYGEVVGEAVQDIAVGEHAHVHNVKSLRVTPTA